MARRGWALVGAVAIVVGTGVASAPAVVASAPHAAKPTSVSLDTSDPVVKSSTNQALHVALEASNNPSTPANDAINVVLSKGIEDEGETHIWTFPISSSVLHVGSTGAGTLEVPAKDIAPFGDVSLTFKPVGKIASKSCQGKVTSETVNVSVSGVFFFDSKSTGKKKWGTVGSKRQFTFSATNFVTWLFSSAASENCVSSSSLCTGSLSWQAQAGAVSFDGTKTDSTSTGLVRASRAVKLSKPKGATRNDTSVGQTTLPTLTGDDGVSTAPTLTVSGNGTGVIGTAMITGSAPTSDFSAPCGKGQTELTKFFTGIYTNGTPALSVAEQIYGALTLKGTNVEGTVDETNG
ncbi:MAG TPA: hypothetical protein VHW74_18200 [Mycobacteriales bacterium]|jgi:hypothetical protein|nr:hypothetical protein [Mycobacteriales bacterium]